MINEIKKAADYIASRIDFRPRTGIILGTGLGGLVEEMDVHASIPYGDIPGFPTSTVKGHSGSLIVGTLGGARVVAMQGRFHYYEGYTPQQVVFPVRVMKFLGIERLFVSNASGGVNPSFAVGDLMVIDDHINLIPNPLIGPNIEELGPRFPDMKNAYDPELIALATRVAHARGIELRYGCYVGLTGPTFETPKEYAYVKAIGGDAVGMSTTPEIIAARHIGLPCFGVSVITDLASDSSVSHEEVLLKGAAAGKQMTRLFIGIMEALK